MRLYCCHICPFAILLAFTSLSKGGEPQVAFKVVDGWVEMNLTDDRLPVGVAQIQVFDSRNSSFALGETDEQGFAQFPLPPGHSLRIEIKIGERIADPIVLTSLGDHVVPNNLLLSFGLAPCCQLPPRNSLGIDNQSDPFPSAGMSNWGRGTGLLMIALVSAVFLGKNRRFLFPINKLHRDPKMKNDNKPFSSDTLTEAGKLNQQRLKLIWWIGAIAVLAIGLLMIQQNARRSAPTNDAHDMAREAEKDLLERRYKPLSAPLAELLADTTYQVIPTQAHPLLNKPAPDFTLKDTNGQTVTLSEKLKSGQPVVLVFYYGYHCNHCVSQLFGLHKDIEKFRELGVVVMAISPDPLEETLDRYKKYGAFSFPVLSDPVNDVAKKFETFVPSKKPNEEGDLLHGTFVIDSSGKLVWANRGDGPFVENRTLLRVVRDAK